MAPQMIITLPGLDNTRIIINARHIVSIIIDNLPSDTSDIRKLVSIQLSNGDFYDIKLREEKILEITDIMNSNG